MQTITAIIHAFNEEENIERCIKSVSWCDKVQVLRVGNDKTGELAKKLGAVVISKNPYRPGDWIAVQKNINWAIDNCTTDWILRVDADEEVTPELREEILRLLEADPSSGIVAYGVPRNQFFFGGFLKGGDWAYDHLVRLFRAGSARYENLVHNHEQFTVKGRVGYLKGRLNHYSHLTLTAAMDKFNSYSATEILDLKETAGDALFKMFSQPPYIFLRWLIWHKGYRDGLRGIVAASYRAIYAFLIYSKRLEYLNEKHR
jgi:glycosyltransferase involved in cell wall biosynthesis